MDLERTLDIWEGHKMKKIWFIALICAALSTSACLITEGCTDIDCEKVVQLNLNNAAGDISGKIIVDGRDHIIKADTAETPCSIDGGAACLRANGVIELRIDEVAKRITEHDVAVDITAQEGDVIRRATGSVMLQETSYQAHEDSCYEGCVTSSASGTLTLQ